MKKLILVIAMSTTAAGLFTQQASAWINSQFSAGVNWNWASGGNCLGWGLFRDGQPYGPDIYHQFNSVPAYPKAPPTYITPNIHHHHQPIVEQHQMHVHQPHIHHQPIIEKRSLHVHQPHIHHQPHVHKQPAGHQAPAYQPPSYAAPAQQPQIDHHHPMPPLPALDHHHAAPAFPPAVADHGSAAPGHGHHSNYGRYGYQAYRR